MVYESDFVYRFTYVSKLILLLVNFVCIILHCVFQHGNFPMFKTVLNDKVIGYRGSDDIYQMLKFVKKAA